jgi:hypothetical protein
MVRVVQEAVLGDLSSMRPASQVHTSTKKEVEKAKPWYKVNVANLQHTNVLIRKDLGKSTIGSRILEPTNHAPNGFTQLILHRYLI